MYKHSLFVFATFCPFRTSNLLYAAFADRRVLTSAAICTLSVQALNGTVLSNWSLFILLFLGVILMAEKKWVIQVTTFGGFSICICPNSGEAPSGPTIPGAESRSKKVWILIKYLLCSGKKQVSSGELIDVIWPQDGSVADPIKSLRLLVHRARLELDKLQYIRGADLICCRGGAYSWNREIPTSIDCEIFENCYRNSRQGSMQDRFELLKKAMDLYHGSFLPDDAAGQWVMALSTYFHSKFTAMCLESIDILRELKQPWDIIDICSNAVIMDPYIEDFHIDLINALAEVGALKEAKEHYQKVSEMFQHELGVSPSPQLVAAYESALKNEKSRNSSMSSIQDDLNQESSSGAFYCEYEFFKRLYSLKRRECTRNGLSVQLALMTLAVSAGGNGAQSDRAEELMKHLKNIIQYSLRKNDIFTRFSAMQYLILLQFTSQEHGTLAIDRIRRNYRKAFPKSGYLLQCTLLPLPPDSLPPVCHSATPE
jgi:DNA-binding SARP family transcriptional activator